MNKNKKGRWKRPVRFYHIKPRALFPELELDESNLQVLCNDCNMGKGRWDDTDWRKKPQSEIKIRKTGKE